MTGILYNLSYFELKFNIRFSFKHISSLHIIKYLKKIGYNQPVVTYVCLDIKRFDNKKGRKSHEQLLSCNTSNININVNH